MMYSVKMWAGFNMLRIVPEMDFCEHSNEYFLFYKMPGISSSVVGLTLSEGSLLRNWLTTTTK
jgi:HSP20 family molecular chaperone IbpA